MDEFSSKISQHSLIYVSSSEEELSDGWVSDCLTDTEQLVAWIEKEEMASPKLIGCRVMMTWSVEEKGSQDQIQHCEVRPLPSNRERNTLMRSSDTPLTEEIRKQGSIFVSPFYQFLTRTCLCPHTKKDPQRKRRCLPKLVLSLGRHSIFKVPPHTTIWELKGTAAVWCAGGLWMR